MTGRPAAPVSRETDGSSDRHRTPRSPRRQQQRWRLVGAGPRETLPPTSATSLARRGEPEGRGRQDHDRREPRRGAGPMHGSRVLVVDMDPQGNASTALGVDPARRTPGTYEVVLGRGVAGRRPGAGRRDRGPLVRPGLHRSRRRRGRARRPAAAGVPARGGACGADATRSTTCSSTAPRRSACSR